MATPESYGIDMGADTEATFGTSADSMGVCFKHTPGGELSGSLGGQPVSEGSKYSSLDSGECESGSRPPSLDRRQAFDTTLPMHFRRGKQLSDADPPRVLAYPFSGPIGP